VDSTTWDARYAERDLVWSAGPNVFVEQVATQLTPGRALDLAAGEGRNAIWLAEQGWEATAVDFSRVALERAQRIAGERLGELAADRLHVVQADLLSYQPPAQAFDLVMVVYLQVAADERRPVLRAASRAVAPGGHLLVIAHDSRNLADGVGGPQDPAVLYTAADVVEDLHGGPLEVVRAETVTRAVSTDAGERHALDCLVLATLPA
jgi:SAM-dependent methyltransferase